jgi:hypothetical protein
MMKRETLLLALAGGASMLAPSSPAQGSLVGLRVEQVESGGGAPPTIDGPSIYHVFAEFTEGADRVLAWGIVGKLFGQGGIENLNSAGSGPGTGFINVGPSTGPPSSPGTPRDWDTYATLGVRYLSQLPAGADPPAYSPGFPPFIFGTALEVPTFGMAVLISPLPANIYGRADFINEGADDARRVLLMQLVVAANQHVHGTIGVLWNGSSAPSNGTVANDLTFSTVPGPGALALLGFACLIGSRRRA